MARPISQAAAVAVFDEHGRVLLIRENYDRRRYGLPGGVVEPGETPWEAARREAREEVGCEVDIDRLVGIYHRIGDDALLTFVFRATIVAGEPALQDDGEIAEVGWFATDALPSPMTNTGPHAVADAARGELGVFREIVATPPR